MDDPVGAVSVHAVNGTWEVLALGLFANGKYGAGLNGVDGHVRGLLYGDSSQLAAQLVGIAANLLYVAPVSAAALFVIDRVVGNRVSTENELGGLDEPEMGLRGYTGGAHTGGAITPESDSTLVIMAGE